MSDTGRQFYNRLSSGKVPIGSWTFDYHAYPPSSGRLGFLARSARTRPSMDAEVKTDHVVITGLASEHRNLITSLQGLGWSGYVTEHVTTR